MEDTLENQTTIRAAEERFAGLMPHPERACEPLLGSTDGRLVFESIFHALKSGPAAKAA